MSTVFDESYEEFLSTLEDAEEDEFLEDDPICDFCGSVIIDFECSNAECPTLYFDDDLDGDDL